MYKAESVLENETCKIVWNFEIRKDYLNLTWKTDLELIKKKEMCHLVDFIVPVSHGVKIKESEKID